MAAGSTNPIDSHDAVVPATGSTNGASNGSNGDLRKPIAEVGRTMPADYLAVGKDSIPYGLRVQLIEQGGLPDVLVETAEAPPPGHHGTNSEVRHEINALLDKAAKRLADEELETSEERSANGGDTGEDASANTQS